jgi:hypothetical protein
VVSTRPSNTNLGGYFEVRRLRWDSKEFWQEDTNAKNCATYYEHAKIINDQKVLVAATETATAAIMDIGQESRLLHVTDESFWLNLVQNLPAGKKYSRHVSFLLGVYFSNCGASLEAFSKLTSSESLCKISRDAAIKLMDAERTILQPEVSKLTDLQQRCIQAIADDWANFDQINQSDVQLLHKQSPLVLTETIARLSKAAKQYTDASLRRVSAMRRRHELTTSESSSEASSESSS